MATPQEQHMADAQRPRPKSKTDNARPVPVIPHPDVTPIHIAGGSFDGAGIYPARRGSTVENDQLTKGDESLQKALRGGFTADVRSEAGRGQQSPLMVALARYLARQPAAKPVAKAKKKKAKSKR